MVCDFSIAIGRKYVANGEKKEDVSFIQVRCWNKLAENVSKYVKKGHRVSVVGSLKQDRWENDSGNKRSKLYVLARSVEFLETKSKGSGADYQQDEEGGYQPDKWDE
jgi:single-strand DNA-binding protein